MTARQIGDAAVDEIEFEFDGSTYTLDGSGGIYAVPDSPKIHLVASGDIAVDMVLGTFEMIPPTSTPFSGSVACGRYLVEPGVGYPLQNRVLWELQVGEGLDLTYG